MIVWGGGPSIVNGPSNRGGRDNPLTDTWQPTATVGAPFARQVHGAVWTGSKMIVWGGRSDLFDGVELRDGWSLRSRDGYLGIDVNE